MQDGHSVGTLIKQNLKLKKLDKSESDLAQYQSALGALMYAMLATHPNIAFTVGALSRHAATPGNKHMIALKQVYRYLCDTVDFHLRYTTASETTPIRYVDADWAADINDCHSITGYVFTICGGAVSWSSKKQSSVALSSTEAEYMAISTAAKEAVWICTLLREIDSVTQNDPTSLHVDNQSVISLTSNAMFHDHMKHISIHHHFIQEKIELGDVSVTYLSTNEQVADILTKGLSREKHTHFSMGMGIFTS
ncbi:hypothetical protein PISMIDRAFT_115243 [Pisolithus microcarpus 441]|uniref:Uncharacterized protein n=1 Tax=Pisolithus microcarpus 441 TaxID=765257 RepID=A0A0C9Z5V7_9AGAM|nr:hypothetical protein PISMIDRAFT_115243 [Pisolithus microcarpus 441]